MMHRFLRSLRNELVFLDDEEKDKVINKYRKLIEEQIADGKKEKDAIHSLGSIEKITKTICKEHNLDYSYCVHKNIFDKNVSSLSKIVANFIREIIKIVRITKLTTSLESFLEVLIKLIVLVFLFVVLKLPFILLDSLAGFINRFLFYPYSSTFDIATNLIISLAYLVVCVIITLKVFGTYHVKEKKHIDEEEIEKVDKEYNWLDMIVRVIIYLVLLIPLTLLAIADLFILVEAAYLVARGVNLIGIPIMLAGIFGLLFALIGTIHDSLYNKRKSYFLAIVISVIVFVVGIFVTFYNFSQFTYPNSLDKSSLKATTEEKIIELDEEDSRVRANNGNIEILLDNNLTDKEVRVVVTYYDDYIDITYDQVKEDKINYLSFDYESDKNINPSKITENVIKDLKKGYIFSYSNVRKYKVKVYANEHTKNILEKK